MARYHMLKMPINNQEDQNMDAVLFTNDNCVYCTQAKALLNSKGLTYDERIIALIAPDDRVLKENQSWTDREELLAAAPAARTVPQIWLHGEHVGGYTDLVARLK